ncbi:MAG: elongation factor G [Nitrospirae bacterium]|nr:elongation factor G [Nitrospirota bacterium]
MANFDVTKIRNVGIIAHGGAGKTSLVEAMLFSCKVIDRMGRVEDGNTVSDFEQEEINKKISLSTALAFVERNGHRINLFDTPGYINFLEDTKASMSAMDGAVVIVSALSGVKAETQKIWSFACKYEIPRIVYVNKMDKENADFENALSEIEKIYETPAFPLQMPIGAGETFSGLVDLIKMKAINAKGAEMEMPADVREQADDYRKRMVERIAESNDALLEKYLEGGELSEDELLSGIRDASNTRRFIPVVCGAATANIGTEQLLDAILLCLPSPDIKAKITPVLGTNPKDNSQHERKPAADQPFCAQVFKTIADPFAGKLTLFRVYSGVLKADSNVLNSTKGAKERIGQIFYMQGKKHMPVGQVGPGEIAAVAKLKATSTGDTLCDENAPLILPSIEFSDPLISYAIAPKNQGEEDKVSNGLHRILDEDPSLNFHIDPETKEMILGGMGQVHLEVTLDRLKRKFGTEVVMKTPQIAYRETIKGSAKVQGKYKKQSGGRGQFGDCWIEFEPLPRNSGFEFVDKIVGGSIPRQYIPAVEKGLNEAIKDGVLAGYPTVDIRATLYDGSFHTVDSSEMAFKVAASMAFKKAVPIAKPVILEPVMKVETVTPDDVLGDVIGNVNSKRGKVQGMEPQAGGNQKIISQVPMSEMLTYANELNALTSGRGIYTMEFSHYDEAPAHISQKIIEERAKTRKEKAEE